MGGGEPSSGETRCAQQDTWSRKVHSAGHHRFVIAAGSRHLIPAGNFPDTAGKYTVLESTIP